MKFVPIKVTKRGWRRRVVEVEWVVNIDASHAATFTGPAAEAMAFAYSNMLHEFSAMLNVAMDAAAADQGPAEIRATLSEHVFTRAAGVLAEPREVV
jgi:hypothetical protein